ncbi:MULTISPECIES: hypothetical protein [unclassified Cytobacillus]|uniref:hypothetical protein n=1 Tax=unclassified Cytobacillus TaxID=2675268 RepID=UPI001357DFF5|nr:hypothetical protein [Cytobacillus sp. AMY 15.2]KAF0819299.1 hypothetical protein KIS4809_1663 [Bacillus sp. ZZV12-4809]MCM3091360.1 hypothetical protein [Cytobacillus sp. AMY 15.2]
MFIIRKKQLVLHHVFLSGTRLFNDRSVYSGGSQTVMKRGTSWLCTGLNPANISYPIRHTEKRGVRYELI